MSSIEDSEKIHIPDQIEHFPPDFLMHLIESKRFDLNKPACPVHMERVRENVKFLQAASTADVFALGIMLL